MDRLKCSIFIIGVVVVIDFISHFIIISEGEKISESVSLIQEYVASGQTQHALNESEILSKKWNESRKKLALFINDKNLDEISDSIIKMYPLIKFQSEEAQAEAECIKKHLSYAHTKDLPYISNIF